MAWLADLAGKAEDFLNRIDHNAAVALQSIEKPSKGHKQEHVIDIGNTQLTPSGRHIPASYTPPPPRISNSAAVLSPRRKSLSTASADDLMDFLNSPQPVSNKAKMTKTVPVESSGDISPKLPVVNITEPSAVPVKEDTVVPIMPAAELESMQQSMYAESVSSYHSDLEPADKSVDFNIEMENRLLKNEIQSLNQEMSQLMQRVKSSERESVSARKESAAKSDELEAQQKQLFSLQSRNNDLEEIAQTRQQQLAAMQIELQEIARGSTAKEKRLKQLMADREQLLKDSQASSGIQTEELQGLQERLSEKEMLLENERANHAKELQHLNNRLHDLDNKVTTLREELSKTETEFRGIQANNLELQKQLQSQASSCTAAQTELETYKQKAQRILQAKEKLISSLREVQEGGENSASLAEMEHLKHERDLLQEETSQLSSQVQSLQSAMQELERLGEVNRESNQEMQLTLQQAVQDETQRRVEIEEDYHQQKEEIRFLREELSRQKDVLTSQLKEREKDISKLRGQLTAKHLATSTEAELESRIHGLTENLIQKQMTVESLSTERNALLLQMERLENQYRDALNIVQQPLVTTTLGFSSNQDANSHIPRFLQETPFDTGVARRVKRAYSSVDSFSIRIGVFLRRYPMARIFVISYMVLLHLWVMVVLCTYSPEIHHGLSAASKKQQ